MRVAIVDYGAGNVASVRSALAHVGVEASLSDDPGQLAAATMLIFPGQGHFGQAMARLRQRGLDHVLHRHVASGRPFVGICLGLQLLFEGSDEAPGVAGLGLLGGHCRRFSPEGPGGARLKVPQIGWNQLHLHRPATPLQAVGEGASMYFVHSYHAVASDPRDVIATADHGLPFVAAVQRDNLFAAQFHPEKSGAAGLRLWSALVESPWWVRPC